MTYSELAFWFFVASGVCTALWMMRLGERQGTDSTRNSTNTMAMIAASNGG